MLLVEPPSRAILRQVIEDLSAERITRDAALSWQKAVVAESGWDIELQQAQGYWYFFSLAYITLLFPDGFYIRQHDLQEYLLDIDQVPGQPLFAGISHLRAHQVNTQVVRWPLAVITDSTRIMARLPGVRGTFERRGDLVEHCHLAFEQERYLLIKQYDEQASQLLLLGNSRDRSKAMRLLTALELPDYFLQ